MPGAEIDQKIKLETKPETKLALIGAPNSGKTTLYNWLTGSSFKTVNYPGSTVEYSVGHVQPALGHGLIYMATDVGGVTVVDAKSGARVWQQRIDGIFSASPVAGDGKK